MTKNSPKESYEATLITLAKELKQLFRNRRKLSWKRLLSFLGAIAALWVLSANSWILAIASCIILISLFVYFVFKDLANSNSIENNLLLISINKKEQAALNHQYFDFLDGTEWKPPLHNYANDLDIFGRASLYQYANRTTSEQGNKLFANWLLSPENDGVIKERQDSIIVKQGPDSFSFELYCIDCGFSFTMDFEKQNGGWYLTSRQDNNF